MIPVFVHLFIYIKDTEYISVGIEMFLFKQKCKDILIEIRCFI